MRVADVYKTKNKYSGSNWNYEDTTKYIINVGEKTVEAGYFIHYKNSYSELPLKYVIELPTSYGCFIKCKYCASSLINSCIPLSGEEIYDIFNYIYTNNSLYNKYLLVTLTGVGDLYYTLENVEKFFSILLENKIKCLITVSSCLWTNAMLERILFWENYIDFKNIQITFISSDTDVISKLIPAYNAASVSIPDLIKEIKKTKLNIFRINYVMIKNINDSEEAFNDFIDLFSEIKDKIIVRISKLNETFASKKNNLECASLENMEYFNNLLKKRKFNSYLFYSFINDNMNCGQLLLDKG